MVRGGERDRDVLRVDAVRHHAIYGTGICVWPATPLGEFSVIAAHPVGPESLVRLVGVGVWSQAGSVSTTVAVPRNGSGEGGIGRPPGSEAKGGCVGGGSVDSEPLGDEPSLAVSPLPQAPRQVAARRSGTP